MTSLLTRAVSLRMDRGHCSAGLSWVGLSWTLSCSLVLCCCPSSMAWHNPKALTRCQWHVSGLCSLQSHEPNKSALYKLSSLRYLVAEIENGLRQHLNEGNVFIAFGPDIASPHLPPITFHPFTLSQHIGSWLCLQHVSYVLSFWPKYCCFLCPEHA